MEDRCWLGRDICFYEILELYRWFLCHKSTFSSLATSSNCAENTDHITHYFLKKYFDTTFKSYFPFTVVTKYWLYSPCCIKLEPIFVFSFFSFLFFFFLFFACGTSRARDWTWATATAVTGVRAVTMPDP